MTTNPPREEIQARMRAVVASDGWDAAWREGLTPWDTGYSQPPLRAILASGKVDFPTQGTALVPGCGTGHDVIAIATQLGLYTIGVDISATALAASAALKRQAGIRNVEFRVDDFFSMDGSFDLVYDYTFFVAIPPQMRPSWARQMNKLVKPGGYLVSLVYPMDPLVRTGTGPPYYVRPNHLVEELGRGWEKLVDEVPKNSTETHRGRESLLVLKRL